jgi:hypothetical protein
MATRIISCIKCLGSTDFSTTQEQYEVPRALRRPLTQLSPAEQRKAILDELTHERTNIHVIPCPVTLRRHEESFE